MTKTQPHSKVQTCGFKTFVADQLERHVKTSHPTLNLICKKCNSSMTSHSILHHYKECHEFKRVNCVYCKFSTDDKKTIAEHLQTNHSKERPIFVERTPKHGSSEVF